MPRRNITPKFATRFNEPRNFEDSRQLVTEEHAALTSLAASAGKLPFDIKAVLSGTQRTLKRLPADIHSAPITNVLVVRLASDSLLAALKSSSLTTVTSLDNDQP